MNSGKLREFDGFFSKLSKTDRIAIVFHRDADGFCSALLAAKAIERFLGKKPELLLHEGYSIFDAKPVFFKKFRKKRINRTIIVDLGIDQKPGLVEKISRFSDVLMIDHHKLYNDLSSNKVVFIKAQFLSKIDASRYPASKLCFDLFSRIADLQDLDWIACVGILGDFGYLAWQKFFDDAIIHNGTFLHELKRLKSLIDAVAILSEKKMLSLFEEFYSAKKPGDLLSSKHWQTLEKLEKEVGGWFDSVNQRAEFFPEIELVWLEVKAKNTIKSPLINKLSSELFPNQTVIVVEDKGGVNLFFSARRQDFKVKMNELLESAVLNIKGASAGGHIPAAAGKVPRARLPDFKRNIIAILKEQLGKQ